MIVIFSSEKMMSFTDFMFLLFPLALFIFFVAKTCLKGSSATSKRQPPSPPKFPVIGNLHQLGSLAHRSLHAQSRRYGPVMLLHLGRVPVLVISSSDAAREVMKNQDLIFSSRPKMSVADRLTYGSMDVAFAPYGQYWRRSRSISVLHLLSSKRVQSFHLVRQEETSLMVEKIRQSCSSDVINLTDMCTSLTNDILCRAALGRKYSSVEEGKNFKSFLREFTEALGAFDVGVYVPWLKWISRIDGLDAKVDRVAKMFDAFLEVVVEDHRARRDREKSWKESGNEGTTADYVDILLEIQRESKDTIEDDVLKALILDMFIGGTDTTSSALVWGMAELMKHPETMENLQNEVREVAKYKEEIKEDDLGKMPYLKAVIKETLRLHPPLPLLVPRESTQCTKVMGYDVVAGTCVIVNAWAIARDPLSWENPEKFHPERFLNSSIDFKGLNFELIPFGAGRRGCPGMTFAMAVDELALAKLVHKFNFALPDGVKEKDLDMSEANGIAVVKKFPLLVNATPYSC